MNKRRSNHGDELYDVLRNIIREFERVAQFNATPHLERYLLVSRFLTLDERVTFDGRRCNDLIGSVGVTLVDAHFRPDGLAQTG
jgi:hypothetical protein